MSQVAISGNASGTGTLTIAAPNTNSNYTLTLPQATTTLVGTDATQTLTNKTIQGGAITSGTAVASTSGTSIDFTSIPSWCKRITVMFNGVSTNGTSVVIVQVGSGSFTTSSYTSNAYSTGSANSIGQANYTTGFGLANSGNASWTISGALTLTLLSANIWTETHTITPTSSNISGGAGLISLSGILDRVRITTVNGTDTFDAGSVNIMYEG